MDWNNLDFILSLSIVPAAVIGLVRFKRIDPSYYPFVYDTWLVLLVEMAVFITADLPSAGLQQAILNVFSLADTMLFIWLFYNWSLFRRNRRLLYFILGTYFMCWGVLTFYPDGFRANNIYFRLLYSFSLVFFSVSMLNKLIVHERGNILRSSKFLICMGLIIFYTFFGIFCVTNVSVIARNVGISEQFRSRLQGIIRYSNLFVNLLYAIAVLWVPRKKNFINPF